MSFYRIRTNVSCASNDDNNRIVEKDFRFCSVNCKTDGGYPMRILRIYLKYRTNYQCEKNNSTSHFTVVFCNYRLGYPNRLYEYVIDSPPLACTLSQLYGIADYATHISSNSSVTNRYGSIRCTYTAETGLIIGNSRSNMPLPFTSGLILHEIHDTFTLIVEKRSQKNV